MFDQERTQLEKKIRGVLTENQISIPETFKWSDIPFSGEWGISTSFFQLAADEARQGKKVKVPLRAQEIAELVKAELGIPSGFSYLEAVRGYFKHLLRYR